jgi:hypothetical protein
VAETRRTPEAHLRHGSSPALIPAKSGRATTPIRRARALAVERTQLQFKPSPLARFRTTPAACRRENEFAGV